MRVLVCGGRDYEDWRTFRQVLIDTNAEKKITLLIHGGHPNGADRMAADFAAQRGMPCAAMKAHWSALGKKAGPLRNAWMIDLLQPDLVLAFPGGSGTASTVRLAVNANIPVREIEGALDG